ncbi:MAG: peptidase T [Succinivibrio sp.]
MNYKECLVDRFIRYAHISSQSDAGAVSVPSSKGQLLLARLLESELKQMNLNDVFLDEQNCILYAELKGNTEGSTVGFVAHLDTVDVSLSPEIRPQVIHYEGGDVLLNKDKDISVRIKEHPELISYLGQDILFSDGTSVLGADNKSAIANIMTALDILSHDPSVKHPTIKIAFVPDEEIGLKGSKLIDLDRFSVDYAYTIDSCQLGEVVYETFNAASVQIDITGVSAHPMSAKGVLVNPLMVAHDLISMFDRSQTPECTQGKEGYWWFTAIRSDPLKCSLSMQIRDHDRTEFELRKQKVEEAVQKLRDLHPGARISCQITDTYENIANNVSRDDKPVALIYRALEELEITPVTYAMRGGTDGSALSARGVVTPNYFTGAHNFHSYAEFLPLDSFEKSLRTTLKIIELSCD